MTIDQETLDQRERAAAAELGGTVAGTLVRAVADRQRLRDALATVLAVPIATVPGTTVEISIEGCLSGVGGVHAAHARKALFQAHVALGRIAPPADPGEVIS